MKLRRRSVDCTVRVTFLRPERPDDVIVIVPCVVSWLVSSE